MVPVEDCIATTGAMTGKGCGEYEKYAYENTHMHACMENTFTYDWLKIWKIEINCWRTFQEEGKRNRRHSYP